MINPDLLILSGWPPAASVFLAVTMDGPMLAAIGGIIVAMTGLVTATGKIALGIFREWLKLRDLEADNTIRTKNDEINTERTGRLKAERTAARQKKEIAALKAQLKARVQP